jgi:hypothetical protein
LFFVCCVLLLSLWNHLCRIHHFSLECDVMHRMADIYV